MDVEKLVSCMMSGIFKLFALVIIIGIVGFLAMIGLMIIVFIGAFI